MSVFALALLRHAITALGAMVVAKGYADDATVEAVAGGVLAAASTGWSLWDKHRLAREPVL